MTTNTFFFNYEYRIDIRDMLAIGTVRVKPEKVERPGQSATGMGQ